MPTPDFSKIWASNSPLPAYTFSDSDYLTGWDFVGSAPPTKNEFDAWFKLVDEKLNYLYGQLQDTASKLYPVGSVYISFNSADPSTLFGGTWQRLKDRFLLACGDSYPPNTTGGSATKTIATSNLPSHTHSCSTAGSHTHARGTMEITGSIKSNDSAEPLTFSDSITSSGALSVGGYHSWANGGITGTVQGASYEQINFKASSNWSGATTSNGSHTHTIGNTGGGLPLNVMPPYQTVYMWRRTA